ncbi:MAG: hypothetical protein AAFR04_01240 [Pseudomonadota bacterium]
MDETVRYVQYFCWHIATIMLAFLAAGFAIAGVDSTFVALAQAATLLSGLIATLGLGIPLCVAEITYRQMPQGWLFVPVTLLGALGLIAG